VDNGKAITDGNVEIDGVKKGKTGEQISFAFKKKTTVDPKTKEKETVLSTITVSKAGYEEAEVKVSFS
jgi:plasmid replication initiation protein